MDIKEVAEIAKTFVKDLFASEGAHSIRLEEAIRGRGNGDAWAVTVSFLRALPENASGIATFVAAADRAYKVVVINEKTRSIESIADKATAA